MLPVCQRRGLKEQGCGNISQRHAGVPLLCSHIRRESQDLICLLKSNVWWINALWDFFFSQGCYSRSFPPSSYKYWFWGEGADQGLREEIGRKAGAGRVAWNHCFLQTSCTMKPSSATAPFQQCRFGACVFVLVSRVWYVGVNLLPLCPATDVDHKAPGLWRCSSVIREEFFAEWSFWWGAFWWLCVKYTYWEKVHWSRTSAAKSVQ